MYHPFQEKLEDLKDQDIDQRIQDLSKKFFIAQRLGQTELLTQLSIFVNIYREELTRRHLEKTKKDLDGDLDKLINVN